MVVLICYIGSHSCISLMLLGCHRFALGWQKMNHSAGPITMIGPCCFLYAYCRRLRRGFSARQLYPEVRGKPLHVFGHEYASVADAQGGLGHTTVSKPIFDFVGRQAQHGGYVFQAIRCGHGFPPVDLAALLAAVVMPARSIAPAMK
jgi:hypothetical protein